MRCDLVLTIKWLGNALMHDDLSALSWPLVVFVVVVVVGFCCCLFFCFFCLNNVALDDTGLPKSTFLNLLYPFGNKQTNDKRLLGTAVFIARV